MGILRSGVADFTRLKVFNDAFEVRCRRSFQRATKLWTTILSEISSVMRQAGSKIMRAARLMHHLLARHCIDFKEYDTRLHFNLITITSHLFCYDLMMDLSPEFLNHILQDMAGMDTC
jgi:hypothetical protein